MPGYEVVHESPDRAEAEAVARVLREAASAALGPDDCDTEVLVVPSSLSRHVVMIGPDPCPACLVRLLSLLARRVAADGLGTVH